MKQEVNGNFSGLTRKIVKGLETVSFKITISSGAKDWDGLREFSDQDVAVSIASRQGALRLEPRPLKSATKAKPKAEAPPPA